MNKKITIQFTALTFLIALAMWGICVVFGLFGLTIENADWLWVIIALCSFSPTIASYIVLKKHNEVKGLREWFKNVFAYKASLRFYLLVITLNAVYLVTQIIVNGLKDAQPFYMLFVLLPVELFAGGLEEAGWRYVLQPRIDKKFGLIISSLIVAVIWAAWHIPVFLPQGRFESFSWFGLFAVKMLGLTFALGAIIRITKNVFLCVLFHCIHNAGSAVFKIPDTFLGNTLSAGLLIVISITAVFISERKNKAI